MIYQSKYRFANAELSRRVCGARDHRLPFIEALLKVFLIPRDLALVVEARNEKDLSLALSFFASIEQYYSRHVEAEKDSSAWEDLYRGTKSSIKSMKGRRQVHEQGAAGEAFAEAKDEILFVKANGHPIQTKNPRQKAYVDSMLSNALTIGIGPAGTGKTFLSIAAAASLLLSGRRRRLIITRPAVEAGESLGYLPGDLEQKIDPYLRPLYDALYDCLKREQVHDMIASRQIEIAPLAYMRGRTLSDAVIILDEAQNCTLKQLKMFLTRLGSYSTMCLSGDITQIDLAPGKSGLARAAKILAGIEGIGIIGFQQADIIRSPLLVKILHAFESEEESSQNGS